VYSPGYTHAFNNTAACITVSRQRLGKHVPTAKGYEEDNLSKNIPVGMEPPFREDLRQEGED
jgi:hypothetical protein